MGDLDDPERSAKLDAAVTGPAGVSSGPPTADGAPLASGVELAIVAEELGRGLADVSFLGPTLAAELRRLAGAPAGGRDRDGAARTRPLVGGLRSPSAGRPPAWPSTRGAPTGLLLLAEDGRPPRLARWPGRRRVGVDLTRPRSPAPDASPATPVPGRPGRSGRGPAAWTALGLSLSCADLVGTMRGALELARLRRGPPPVRAAIGSFQAVQHLLADAHVLLEGARSVALHAAWAVDALPAARRPGGGRRGQGVLRPRRPQGVRDRHPGARRASATPGSAWPTCTSGAPSSPVTLLGGAEASLTGCCTIGVSGVAVDFGDSPEESAFRHRLREWLPTTIRDCPHRPPTTTTGPAGRRGTSRSSTPGSSPCRGPGHRRPGAAEVYEVIVDEELAAAGAPPRPSLGYLVQGILEHGSEETRQRFLPGIVNGRDRWCQGFSEPDAGSDLASLRTRATRGRRVRHHRPQGLDQLLRRRRVVPGAGPHRPRRPRTTASRPSPCRCDQPGIEQRPLRMINGVTKEFGEVFFDGARVPAADMIGRPGGGLGPGHDGGQPRTRAR